ncbi:MAG: BMP family ABC transporter substrate-binding protein [Gaiella sp.]|nr:BMP family ABC transporter substrate-binding protein [Gaiella sp.]
MTRLRPLAALLLVALVAMLAASCGGGDGGSEGADVRVALVTDIGGLNDRGFNSLANQGLERAESELGVQGRVFISKAASDYVPNLTSAAREYDLVVAVGFLMGDALATVAQQFPDTDFAIVDYPWSALEGAPPNVRGLVFAEQEAGYLAGVAAATVATGGTISAVGGQAVPAVVAFLAGYRAGAKATDQSVRVIQGYSQDFVDQAKCTELALTQIARGSKVVFAAAGGCGLGALQAAKERNAWGIGVDADQGYLGDFILTSAVKKVDVAVYDTIQAVVDDSFAGGEDSLYDVSNDGVGYGEVSERAPDRDALIETLDDVSQQIADGEIDVPRS